MTNGANRSDLITNIQSGSVGCVEPIWVPTTFFETATSGGNTQIHTVTSSTQSSITSFPPDTSTLHSWASSSSDTFSTQHPGVPDVTKPQPDPSAIPVTPLGSGSASAVTTANNTSIPSSSSSTPDFSDGVFQTFRTPLSTPSMILAIVTSTLTVLTTTAGLPCSLCKVSPTARGL